jgi:hypothetical protein
MREGGREGGRGGSQGLLVTRLPHRGEAGGKEIEREGGRDVKCVYFRVAESPGRG